MMFIGAAQTLQTVRAVPVRMVDDWVATPELSDQCWVGVVAIQFSSHSGREKCGWNLANVKTICLHVAFVIDFSI